MMSSYPESEAERSAWILARRLAKGSGRAEVPNAVFAEEELSEQRELVRVATLLLAGRECPWRCLMCDLWQGALAGPTPPGAIPAQISAGLRSLQIDPAQSSDFRQIKLYNGGSFFDAGAVPPADDAAVASLVDRFERVVVECHPRLVGSRAVRFRDRLLERGLAGAAPLEVAMGLETVHPVALARLNKRMTLDDFSDATAFLRGHGIAVRAFVLVSPPFVPEEEAVDWVTRAVDFALDRGVGVVTLIPVRATNGAMQELQRQGAFSPPRLSLLEAALRAGVSRRRGRVFADLWDLEQLAACPACFQARRDRLGVINRTQDLPPAVVCSRCGAG